MAIAGVVMQNAIFSGVIATDAILAVRATELAAQPQFRQLLWDLNHAAFGLNPASLTVALGGFALAVLTSGTAPRWLAGLGLAGAAMLILGAIQVVPVLEESPTSLIAFVGFFVWISFIVAASVVMLRPAPRLEAAPVTPALA